MSAKKFWSLSAISLLLLTLLAAWGLSYLYLEKHTRLVSDRLQLLNELRKGAVEQYLSTADAELRFWASSPGITAAQAKFNQLWEASPDKAFALQQLRQFYVENNPFPEGEYRNLDDAGDGSPYSLLHQSLHPTAKLFVTVRGYYDVFLIGADGDVFYSVEKERDFGTNLQRGAWRDTGLADVYKRAVDQMDTGGVATSDMEAYGPSHGDPAIFMAKALQSDDGELLGVIAFQLPTSKILSIMNYTSGMGETGETYLVGQDRLMRSDSRFTEQTSVLKQHVDTPTAARALEGYRGVEFIEDYRGVEVLSAYTSVAVGETIWAVMAEIDRDEIAVSAAADRPNLSGILLFFFSLAVWSVWYWRGRSQSESESGFAHLDLELDGSDFGDSSA